MGVVHYRRTDHSSHCVDVPRSAVRRCVGTNCHVLADCLCAVRPMSAQSCSLQNIRCFRAQSCTTLYDTFLLQEQLASRTFDRCLSLCTVLCCGDYGRRRASAATVLAGSSAQTSRRSHNYERTASEKRASKTLMTPSPTTGQPLGATGPPLPPTTLENPSGKGQETEESGTINSGEMLKKISVEGQPTSPLLTPPPATAASIPKRRTSSPANLGLLTSDVTLPNEKGPTSVEVTATVRWRTQRPLCCRPTAVMLLAATVFVAMALSNSPLLLRNWFDLPYHDKPRCTIPYRVVRFSVIVYYGTTGLPLFVSTALYIIVLCLHCIYCCCCSTGSSLPSSRSVSLRGSVSKPAEQSEAAASAVTQQQRTHGDSTTAHSTKKCSVNTTVASRPSSQRGSVIRVRDIDIADRADNRIILVMAFPAAVCLSTVEVIRAVCARELLDDMNGVVTELADVAHYVVLAVIPVFCLAVATPLRHGLVAFCCCNCRRRLPHHDGVTGQPQGQGQRQDGAAETVRLAAIDV